MKERSKTFEELVLQMLTQITGDIEDIKVTIAVIQDGIQDMKATLHMHDTWLDDHENRIIVLESTA